MASRRRWCDGWSDGLACAPGSGCRVYLRGQRFEWNDGAQVDAATRGAQALWRHCQLCLWKRWWNLWPESISRRHAGRRHRNRSPWLVAGIHRNPWSLRAGRHGRALRGDRARSDDIGFDDL